MPATFTEDFQSITFGVLLMPLVIPWGYVYRHYIRRSPLARVAGLFSGVRDSLPQA